MRAKTTSSLLDRLKEVAPWILLAGLLASAHWSHAESPTTWTTGTFEATPDGANLISDGDNKIREFKSTVRDYGEAEICWSDSSSTGCSIANSGLLRQGAARAFFTTAAPTNLNGTSTTGSTALDNGRLWVDSDSSGDGGVTNPRDNKIRVYDAAWEEANGVPDADRNAWYAASNQVTESLLAVKATKNATTDISGANCASPVAIPWNTESFDDSSMHDNATNNSRLTTPSGATRVRLHAFIHLSATNGLTYNFPVGFRQDGSSFVATQTFYNSNSAVQPLFTIESGPITVTGGTTYFEVIPNATTCTNTDGSGDTVQTDSYFSMEVIQ